MVDTRGMSAASAASIDARGSARSAGTAGGGAHQRAGGDEAGSGGAQTGGDRHKYAEHGNACVCGHDDCSDILHNFYGTGHVYDRKPVVFMTSNDPRFEPFRESLIRNLHVPDDKKRKMRANAKGYRFPVAAHHFTEEVVRRFLSNTANRGVWKVRLDRKEAAKILRSPLDDRDKDDGGYFINANVTIEESRAAVDLIRSERSHHQSVGRKSDDQEKEALRISLERKNASLARREAELKDKEERIATLERQNQALQRKNRRARKAKSELSSENEQLKEQQTELTLDDVTRILLKVGGLNRLTLFDPEWHKNNEDAARVLWGFNSFSEALAYVKCFFPDVDTSKLPGLQRAGKRKRKKGAHDPADDVKMPPISNLEKCLLCKLFFRRDLSEQFIGLIFNKHRTTIGRLLKEWAPRWGKAGEQCSILDITRSFLESEEPERSKEVGVRKAVLVDGTDTAVERKRSNPTFSAEEYSPKNDCEATRCLTLSTAGGMTFEHTPLVGARCSEKRLYRFMGELGIAKARAEEWEDVAIGLSEEDKICRLKLATEDMFDYHDIEKELDTIKVFEKGTFPIESDALLTATLEGRQRMLKPASLSEKKKATKEADERIPTMDDIHQWFKEQCAINEVAKKGTGKMSPKITADVLKEQGQNWLKGGVNGSGKEKLAQLEVHERLHRAYQGKHLKKTALAHFLLHAKDDRHKLLKWMGSSLAPDDVPKPSKEELPDIWLRLAKIPPGWQVLGDKGFEKATRLNPRLNKVRTPWKLSNAEVKDYRRSAEMIAEDQETSFTRAPAENNYERYRNEDILKHKVPIWVIAMLPYAHEWAHANMNLQDPIRKPGSDNIIELTEDYWDKHIE